MCYRAGNQDFFKLQLILGFEGLRSEHQLMKVVADHLDISCHL